MLLQSPPWLKKNQKRQYRSVHLLVHDIRRLTQCPQKVNHFTQLLPKKAMKESVSQTSDSNFNCPFLNCKFKTPYKNNLERHVTRMHPERGETSS